MQLWSFKNKAIAVTLLRGKLEWIEKEYWYKRWYVKKSIWLELIDFYYDEEQLDYIRKTLGLSYDGQVVPIFNVYIRQILKEYCIKNNLEFWYFIFQWDNYQEVVPWMRAIVMPKEVKYYPISYDYREEATSVDKELYKDTSIFNDEKWSEVNKKEKNFTLLWE